MLFPDQDFLALFFKGEWKSTPWQYNALKTWRYWHPEMWRDEEVRNCHYIIGKPWVEGRMVGRREEVMNRWWWDEWGKWVGEVMKEKGKEEGGRVVEVVRRGMGEEYT